MATLGTENLTLADIAKRADEQGNVDAPIVELLAQDQEVFADATLTPCNEGNRHRSTVRTGIPEGVWRKLYQGVPSTKSSTAQVYDAPGMLRNLAKIDAELLTDATKDPSGVLLSESIAFIQGLKQQAESTLWYGDTAQYPERFHGFAPRYSAAPGTDEDLSTFNILDAEGTGADNTSIWLVGWSPETCTMIYPEGSVGGLSKQDLGVELTTDANGDEYPARNIWYKWNLGLAIRDWRSVGRIASIDFSDLNKNPATSGADLINLMIELEERVMHYAGPMGARFAWYMHPRVRTFLRKQINTAAGNQLTQENFAGKRVLAFNGVPIRASRKILLTEADPTA